MDIYIPVKITVSEDAIDQLVKDCLSEYIAVKKGLLEDKIDNLKEKLDGSAFEIDEQKIWIDEIVLD